MTLLGCGDQGLARNTFATKAICGITPEIVASRQRLAALSRLDYAGFAAAAGVAKLIGLTCALARCGDSREWRNWQTRWLQVPVPARAWGFKSPLAHANEMAPDLGFYLSGWGSFALEVLEKGLIGQKWWMGPGVFSSCQPIRSLPRVLHQRRVQCRRALARPARSSRSSRAAHASRSGR